QTGMMLAAFVLAFLAWTSVLQAWHIALLAFVVGICNSFDAPARQAMVVDLVDDRRDLMNAVAMNSTLFNVARIVGPAIGGIILAALGAAWCFTINGITFLAVIAALLLMRLPPLQAKENKEPLVVQLAAGWQYVRQHKIVRTIIAVIAVCSLFGFSYVTLMPAYAVDVLQVGEAGLGALNAAVGVGALVASLLVASLSSYEHNRSLLTWGNLLFPASLIALAMCRSLLPALLTIAVVGFAFMIQITAANTLIQTIVSDELRGRVMAFYVMSFFGTSPFAGLQAGAVAEVVGPAMGIGVGGAIALAFSVFVFFAVPELRQAEWDSPGAEREVRAP
ncbi:MAG: MFS transporter, partial [Chloroflexi bacterium]|nr:MFS transporter [Chloroflexota bacterium]